MARKSGGKGKITNKINKSYHSMNPDRKAKKQSEGGGGNLRDKSTIKRLQMYRNFKPIRNSSGKIIKSAPFQSRLAPGTSARIEPNRKWFGNTRVITQNALQNFQTEMKKVMSNPYQVVLKQTKLPITLLNEKYKNKRVHILDTESFESTFGSKAQRKRPKFAASDVNSLAELAEASSGKYDKEKDVNLVVDNMGVKDEPSELIFKAGQSRRVWGELYKVIDSSDVIAQILDARDPEGTRSKQIEEFLRKEKPHKHVILILNKCDLVPTWVAKKWVAVLSREIPTMAFKANITNSFGRQPLIQLLRQFTILHKDKKQISVGFIGYPNVGKSSVINTLRKKSVCNVAPIAGETKVWQYVTLTKKIYLIDCPGVIYPVGNTEVDKVLKGVVRVENIKDPEDYIPTVLERIRKEAVLKTYGVDDYNDHEDFLEKLAIKAGRLLKAGQADTGTVARMVLNDWQRGKLPFYVRPPEREIDTTEDDNIETVDDSSNETSILSSPDTTNLQIEVTK
ncbi:hypothetical protein HELRODRAFT_192836 [Helobdella robusta]|uniref:Nucleolar GTP-binding protein 2 n=1 Tax=Helobdella robusta TaxID=6412 RepID=T1FUC4_HELRO|nr:hypothetical protein HELRODRAFT_192836 [Helobdella robusta]ESN99492.1 hypothetical protein HELRODRAFT_192836 [Helobdella robusta]